MEKQGYVTIQRGPRKGGPVKVVMTDKGKEAVDLAWETGAGRGGHHIISVETGETHTEGILGETS